MSAKYFITFEPTQGIYKKAIKPYKSWREGSDMSKKIEVDGGYYRVLRTIGIFNKYNFRKGIVCDENGQIVEDEEITRRCLKIIVYLAYYQVNKQDINFLLTQGKKEQHEPVIHSFKQIQKRLGPLLSDENNEAMSFHLHYLKEVYRIQHELSKTSRQLLSYVDQLKSMSTDTYDPELIRNYMDVASRRVKLKQESEAILYEDGIRARTQVKNIMGTYDLLKRIRDIENYFYVLDDIKGANKVSKRFIKQSKYNRYLFEKWLDFDNGPFTKEKLIYELRYVYDIDMMVDKDVNRFIEKHWCLSPKFHFK